MHVGYLKGICMLVISRGFDLCFVIYNIPLVSCVCLLFGCFLFLQQDEEERKIAEEDAKANAEDVDDEEVCDSDNVAH